VSEHCCVCGLGVFQGASLVRVNKLGEVPAVWACFEHTDRAKPDVVRIIEEDNERRSKL
jgi:hypothetical protein